MKQKNRAARLSRKQAAWDRLPVEDRKGTKRPGSIKKT